MLQWVLRQKKAEYRNRRQRFPHLLYPLRPESTTLNTLEGPKDTYPLFTSSCLGFFCHKWALAALKKKNKGNDNN